MNNEIILSFCIPLHNRSRTVISHIENILKIDSHEFDIIIADTSDDGKDLLSLWNNNDDRVKVFRGGGRAGTPAMTNWKNAMECADGVFAFHLNDRDEIVTENLLPFIEFLKKHKDFNGGICKFLNATEKPVLCKSSSDALMNIPYFAVHTTGVVIKSSEYRKIDGLEEIFTCKFGMHPHDVILGRLSEKGNLFIYTDKIWQMASPEFYKQNVSGVVNNKDTHFFEPEERLYELKCFLKELESLKVGKKIKKQKFEQMIRNYLHLSTSGYYYFLESDYETIHYGIEQQKLSVIRKYRLAWSILNMFCKELEIENKYHKKLKKWLFKDIMISILAKYTSKIDNKYFKQFLRKLRISREKKDNAVLR